MCLYSSSAAAWGRGSRGDRGPPQAHGPRRQPPDPLAHHADLFPSWLPPLHPLPRLQGGSDQVVFPELCSMNSDFTVELKTQQPQGPFDRPRGGLGSDPGLHRRADHDRGPGQPRGRQVPGRRPPFRRHLRRRGDRRRSRRGISVPPREKAGWAPSWGSTRLRGSAS